MNEILIYDEIGSQGVKDLDFIMQLNGNKGKEVKVRINCPGGDVFQGFAIYNAIKEHGLCDIYIDGVSASMASIIMLAGRKIYASKNAMIMIHNPKVSGYNGNSQELASLQQLLDKIQKIAIENYSNRTGLSNEELVKMLDAETWLNSSEALELGFIDEITGEILEIKETNLKGTNPKMVFQNFKPKYNINNLFSLLSLPVGAKENEIINKIKEIKDNALKTENEFLKLKGQIKLDQQKEAKTLTSIAIQKGIINKNLERVQILAFENNFSETKSDLMKAIEDFELEKKHGLLKEVILGAKASKNSKSELKTIDEWTLNDYRKNNPKALENDNELYQRLIKKEFNN